MGLLYNRQAKAAECPIGWVLKFKWCEARYVANRIRRIAASVVERSEFSSDVAGRHRRRMTLSRDRVPVVVRGRESRPHGEGGQQVLSSTNGGEEEWR